MASDGEREALLEDIRELERLGFIELDLVDGEVRVRVVDDGLDADVRETLTVAWREVLGDEPLPAAAMDAAVVRLLAGGFSRLPGVFCTFSAHPYEVLASLLDGGDPRAKRLRGAVTAGEVRHELQWEGRSFPRDEALRRIHATCRRLRASRGGVAPVTHRRRTRARSSRQRRARTGSTGCRSPGRDDDDPEVDPPAEAAA